MEKSVRNSTKEDTVQSVPQSPPKAQFLSDPILCNIALSEPGASQQSQSCRSGFKGQGICLKHMTGK
ncbi:hypothetical protein TWF751_008613 [Orbilia oligospora]|nr:hypothetical protein TWF751_008613 [Orbilia oligospora]